MPFKTAYGVGGRELARFVEENWVVKSWCQKFSSRPREGWLSGSRRDKARVLCRFFKWLKVVKDVDLSPEELLNRQIRLRKSLDIEDRKWLLRLVLEHTRGNPDFADYADMTKYGIFTIIRRFLLYHEVPLTTAKRVYGTKRGRKWHRKQINVAEAKKVLGGLSQRDRTILLIMLQSGMDIGSVLNKSNFMWHNQVKPQLNAGCERLKIEFIERKGRGAPYFTYISRDGIHELQKWLNERRTIVRSLLEEGKNVDKAVIEGEPIFITRFGKPLRAHQFIKQFNRMMHGQVTTHMFRKLFKTEASVPDRAVDRKIVEFWMGHINGIDAVGGAYDRTPEIHEEILEKEYAKLEPYINIYSSPIATRRADPLLADIEKVMHIEGGREFLERVVKEIDQKTMEYLRKMKKVS